MAQAFIQRTSFAGLKIPPPLPPRPTVHRDCAKMTILHVQIQSTLN